MIQWIINYDSLQFPCYDLDFFFFKYHKYVPKDLFENTTLPKYDSILYWILLDIIVD